MTRQISRRDLLRLSGSAAALTVGTGYFSQLSAQESKSPNEKLDIACIGVANRASANVSGVAGQNIVAICDIDDRYLSAVGERFPKAQKYHDVRKVLDAEKTLDAVVISTPDHMHAPATLWAMQLGKHVYCEKPLTHSVAEARQVTELAKKQGVATQLGTQIHAGDNYRRVVELVQSGAVGKVSEVDVWVGKGWGGGDRPKDTPEVPSHIKWDLWLGPAPERPFHGVYHPANWRRWWDFGGGTLGDMGCHYVDLPFWALGLKYPKTVWAEGPEVHPETAPLGLTVHYEYAASDTHGPIKFTWRDGNHTPSEVQGHKVPGSGVMFRGDKGDLFASYGDYKLYPEDKFADFQPPEKTIPSSIGHYEEWIKACKEGTPTTCDFAYSGPLTEAVLLGNVAFRTGEKLEWDGAKLKATNSTAADAYLSRPYRKGWEV